MPSFLESWEKFKNVRFPKKRNLLFFQSTFQCEVRLAKCLKKKLKDFCILIFVKNIPSQRLSEDFSGKKKEGTEKQKERKCFSYESQKAK